jgi:hypothetical protein
MEEATGLTMPEHRGREGKVLRVLLSGRCLPQRNLIMNHMPLVLRIINYSNKFMIRGQGYDSK